MFRHFTILRSLVGTAPYLTSLSPCSWCCFAMGRYASYTAAFKLKAVEYALEHGNCATRRYFGVNEFCVRYWRRQLDKLKTTKRGEFPGVETSLLKISGQLTDRPHDSCHAMNCLPGGGRCFAKG